MYKVYISTFGRKVISIKKAIPIEVGAVNRNNFIYSTHDDIGENISMENEYYGELTGLYWIWKNTEIKDDDIIGFFHYNKALKISERKAKKWLKNHPNGFIVLTPCRQSSHPNLDEVHATERALSSNKNDLDAWEILYDEVAGSRSDTNYGSNMFITSGYEFKAFCLWLFSILQKVRNEVGDKPEESPYMRRYCAFMGERLLSVYVLSRGKPVLPVKKKIRKWWLTWFYPIVQLFHPNKEKKYYRFLSAKFGAGSSYTIRNKF